MCTTSHWSGSICAKTRLLHLDVHPLDLFLQGCIFILKQLHWSLGILQPRTVFRLLAETRPEAAEAAQFHGSRLQCVATNSLSQTWIHEGLFAKKRGKIMLALEPCHQTQFWVVRSTLFFDFVCGNLCSGIFLFLFFWSHTNSKRFTMSFLSHVVSTFPFFYSFNQPSKFGPTVDGWCWTDFYVRPQPKQRLV